MEAVETTIARHEERIKDLEEWRDEERAVLKELQNEMKQLREDYAGRPTWPVTIVISILSTLVGTMIVYIVTNL